MVGTRHGFGAASGMPSTSANVFALYDWLVPLSLINASEADNVLVVINSASANAASITGYNLATGNFNVSVGVGTTGTPAAASVVGAGMRLYVVLVSSKQKALSPGFVITLAGSAGNVVQIGDTTIFDGPVNYAPTVSEPGAGSVTAGIHRLGYLVEYTSGFTTRVSPDNSSTTAPTITTFVPISQTAAGSKNLRLSFANNWNSTHGGSTGMVAVSVVMTTTSNLNQYYIVPGSRTPLASIGSLAAFTITFDISDGDLSSQGIDATPYLYKYTQSSNNTLANTPFKTKHITLFGDRMAYLASLPDNTGSSVDAMFVSDRNDYQTIFADNSLIQLPGQLPMTTAFRLGTVNFICGAHQIWGVSDNNDVPASWAAPRLVDGRHGTLAIRGVEVSPSGQLAWLADQAGLFVFTGSPITDLPISYYQTDWARINWSAAYCVKIRDDAGKKRVYVMVALDSATTPSHMMTFDYTNGITAETVMYSLDNLSGYSLGAMELVRNDLAGAATANVGMIELWLGSSGTAAILRKLSDADTNPYRDGSAAINGIWRSALFPGRDGTEAPINMHHGFQARIKGSGNITPVMYGLDQSTESFTCKQYAMSSNPDSDELFFADIRSELACVEFNTNTLDTHWQLAYLKYYYSPYLMQR